MGRFLYHRYNRRILQWCGRGLILLGIIAAAAAEPGATNAVVSPSEVAVTNAVAGVAEAVSTNTNANAHTNAFKFGAGAAPMQTLSAPDGDMTGAWIKMVGSLALVLAIFFGFILLYRNWNRFLASKTGVSALSVVEYKPIANRQCLYVIQYKRSRYLISSGPTGTTMLSPLDSDNGDNGGKSAARDGGNGEGGESAGCFDSNLRNAFQTAKS